MELCGMKIEDNFDIPHACQMIIWIWAQYGNGWIDDKNQYHIDHDFMTAGECATEFLEHYGYGFDDGCSIVLTRKGLILANEEQCKGIDE